MDRKYIQSVKPLTDHVLQVDFISGSRLLLDMKPYLDKFRFRSLSDPQVWNSAVTNGIFVRFGDVEMSHNELFSMAEQEHHRKGGKWYEKKADDTTARLVRPAGGGDVYRGAAPNSRVSRDGKKRLGDL